MVALVKRARRLQILIGRLRERVCRQAQRFQKLLVENFTTRAHAISDSAGIARRLRKDRIISTVSFLFLFENFRHSVPASENIRQVRRL